VPDTVDERTLRELLQRWVSLDLIDDAQARRIEESELSTRDARPSSRRSAAVEVLGYVGTLLALVAGMVAVGQLWSDLTLRSGMVFAAVGSVVLLGAGFLVKGDDEPALRRLRSALWLGATAALAAAVGLRAGDSELSSPDVVLTIAAASTVMATWLWFLNRSVLQQLAMFASYGCLLGAAVAAPDDTDLEWWTVGLTVWCYSLVWGVVARRGWLTPRKSAEFFAAAGLLAGAMQTMYRDLGMAFAIATVVAILAAGVVLDELLFVGVGAIGVVAVIPDAVWRYLPDSSAAPLAVFVVGLFLVCLAIWLARRHRRHDPDAAKV
jgi:hypothetical protein